MTSPLSATEIDSVLANSSWVLELALQLVDDRHLADDLVQEAYMVAMAKRDTVRSSFPAWIRAVLRNLVRERARSDRRRNARELATSCENESPSTLDIVEKLALHRQGEIGHLPPEQHQHVVHGDDSRQAAFDVQNRQSAHAVLSHLVGHVLQLVADPNRLEMRTREGGEGLGRGVDPLRQQHDQVAIGHDAEGNLPGGVGDDE